MLGQVPVHLAGPQARAVGVVQPQTQQLAATIGRIAIRGARVQHEVVVDELDVALLEPHRHVQLFARGHGLHEIERRALLLIEYDAFGLAEADR